MSTGGYRSRLIHESMFRLIRDSLDDLGWYDEARKHDPVTVVPKPVQPDEEVPFNTVAIEVGDSVDEDLEIGSYYTNDDWLYFIDIFAQTRGLGLELSGDIRDILRGKHPTIGRDNPVLEVYDYTPPTPTLEFVAKLDQQMGHSGCQRGDP